MRGPLLIVVCLALISCGNDTVKPSGVTPDKPSTDPSAAQKCVDTINGYRKTLGLPAYTRWTDAESCADAEAKSDAGSGAAHGAFGSCGEWAQNECPGWAGTPETMIEKCLASMWAEGPGSDFGTHGHYLNMASASYTRVACGFFVTSSGAVWSVQNFK